MRSGQVAVRRALGSGSYPALMAAVISMAVVTLAFTVMTLRFIR